VFQQMKSAVRRVSQNPKLVGALALSLAMTSAGSAAGDYVGSKAAREFTQRMVEQHGFSAAEVEAILAGAQKQQAILDAIARPAEKSKPWHEYRDIFLDERRIADGVAFWKSHEETLKRAEKVYGVAPEVIVAIIGVETRYGTVTGRYRVLDALATLGFDYPPRAAFFSKELEHFLLLTKEQKQDVNALKGSYAGAMGYGQFMPSSYRAYAADFDGDGVADIWGNPTDAIGSVANYFKVHGWQPRQLVMVPAVASGAHQESLVNKIKRPELSLADLRSAGYRPASDRTPLPDKAVPLTFEGAQGQEFWLGFNNFYVITRYNRSPLYARAVWELSEAIKTRKAEAAL
jgi:membrane-bound lytic murein transglycosylase B